MNKGASHNQTKTFLMQRFEEAGIRPYTRFGQNFLIDLNLQRLIVSSAELGPDDVVLEVGTGTGALTYLMAEQAASVVTVEIDTQLFQLASEELHRKKNVTMIRADALKNKSTFNPLVLDAIASRLAEAPGRRLKLVANLPYNVATPIISNMMTLDTPPHSMVVTIQKELGDRIIARPRTKDYSGLSVWLQCQCKTSIVRIMPPTVFWPRPKVQSAIVHLETDYERRGRITDLHRFHKFARMMFFHRRKYLRREILSAFKRQITKPQVDEIMEKMGLIASARAEELEVSQLLRLCDMVYETLPEGSTPTK